MTVPENIIKGVRRENFIQFVEHIKSLLSDCGYITIDADAGRSWVTAYRNEGNSYNKRWLEEDPDWPIASYSATGYSEYIPSTYYLSRRIILRRQDNEKELVIMHFSDELVQINESAFFYSLDALDTYILKWAISE